MRSTSFVLYLMSYLALPFAFHSDLRRASYRLTTLLSKFQVNKIVYLFERVLHCTAVQLLPEFLRFDVRVLCNASQAFGHIFRSLSVFVVVRHCVQLRSMDDEELGWKLMSMSNSV